MPLSNEQIFKGKLHAGCDEAGRGCLAGPVVAAAVILPKDFYHPLLNDSKQVSEKKREILRPVIENSAIAWGVAFVYPEKIDEINILNASILAMHKALDKLTPRPEAVLVDGNRFKPYQNLEYACMIKGDAKFTNIAAASILAKTHRDEYMRKIDAEFPSFLWAKNKGYPTKQHREAIEKYGATPYHRMSFRLTDTQMKIEF